MQIATTQSTTTDIIVNLRRFLNNVRRFIDYPFRELSFGVDMMGGALDDAQRIWIPGRPPLVIRRWVRRGTKPAFLAAKMVNQEIPVEKLQLPQYLYLPHCGSRIDWQGVQLRESFRLNSTNFTVNSFCLFRCQIGWDHIRWVGEVNR